MPNSIPEKLWTHISADFITKLPLVQGYDSILVVVDWLTKMVYFIPTTEKTSAERLARFHPQTDGQTERVNQELEQYLRMFISHRQEQWPKWLGTAEFAYNNKVHLST